ncbi:MAG: putative selenium-dependent hydroxylase accessory protein YqeC [Deltaproteobacteria bacterium]|nr:putative selenium-dependent hydroxylase accessory protein YqeC [Deltaproteobacteria bacterium]
MTPKPEKSVSRLTTALALEPREHLALVGGGGKTSLMFALAEELRLTRKRVVTSTTTKIRHREALSSLCVIVLQTDSSWRDKLREGLQIHGHVFLARSLLDSGKVQGISSSISDELFRDQRIDYLLLEADGAAGHPVKAHAEHEPVIPASATKVVAMLGLEAVSKPLEPGTVFRIDLFRKLTGLNQGQRLTPAILSRLFLDPEGIFRGTPVSAKKIAFLNKLDLLAEESQARDLADLIFESNLNQIDRVVIGSILKGKYYGKHLCQNG